jgi:hypothetical protein
MRFRGNGGESTTRPRRGAAVPGDAFAAAAAAWLAAAVLLVDLLRALGVAELRSRTCSELSNPQSTQQELQ